MKINKKIIGALLLFFIFLIITLFLNGTHFDLESSIIGIILTMFTSTVWMIVPTIFRIKSKKKIENKKGIKICSLNSLIITSIIVAYCIMLIVKYKEIDETTPFSPSIFAKELISIIIVIGIIYYFINYLFFVSEKEISKEQYNETILEKGLPTYLEMDLKRLKDGLKNNVSYIDCLINEVQGSVNTAWTDGDITEEQCDYLYKKYIRMEMK